ncbi:MAG: Ig-like domain-containing protein [Verrucomicrobiales bacterium]|nr:Ig-like domain-containing protein [Verrucomicrobiales bacterium]
MNISRSILMCFSRVLNLAMLVFGLMRLDSTIVGAELTGTVTSVAFGYRADLTALGTSDWAHWGLGGLYPSFDHKATGGSQISDVTEVGVGQYLGHQDQVNYRARLVSWSDGTPTESVTDNAGFIFSGDEPAVNQGMGYSFTAPADTTLRTLYVLAGGFGTTPTLQASLSDASAPDFVDARPFVGGNYQNVYAITYRAASAGQTLTVTYTRTAGGASVDLKAAWLVTGLAPTVSITAPANGATVFGSPDTVTLTAEANDAGGTISQVEFFADGNLIGSDTTSPYSIAWTNATAGNHTLTAKATDNDGNSGESAGVPIVVLAGGSLLGGTVTSMAFGDRFDLTALGTSDWAHWGLGGLYPSFDHKANGGSQISDVTEVGVGPWEGRADETFQARLASWSDGMPIATVTNDYGFIFTEATSGGFSFTAPADTTLRTLYVLAGGLEIAQASLVASLSDASATDFTSILPSSGANFQRVYALTYRAASAGQTLTVTYTKVGGGSGPTVHLKAAWLVNGIAPTVSITAPTNGATVTGNPASVTITADADDVDGTITQVEFFADGNLVGADTDRPYSLTWTNATPGNHVLTAKATDNAGNSRGSPGIAIVVVPPSGAGELGGTLTPAAFGDRFDLTALGTSDWAHWGRGGTYPTFDHKAAGGSQISDVIEVETEAGDSGKAFAGADYQARLASWSDGMPTASVTDDYGFIYAGDVPAARQGMGYSFTVSADTMLRTLYVLAGGHGTTPTLRASLSDSSAADFVDTTPPGAGVGNYQRVYAITYRAASTGQTLTVSYTRTAAGASVDLKAAWLVNGSPPTTSRRIESIRQSGANLEISFLSSNPAGIHAIQQTASLVPPVVWADTPNVTFSGAPNNPITASFPKSAGSVMFYRVALQP